MEDHVHALLGIPARMALSDAVKNLKGASSGWVKENLERCRGFAWQDGYGAFTVSKSQVAEVEQYIQGQREHHRLKTFQEEFRALLRPAWDYLRRTLSVGLTIASVATRREHLIGAWIRGMEFHG